MIGTDSKIDNQVDLIDLLESKEGIGFSVVET
jgi:hypothetical protein